MIKLKIQYNICDYKTAELSSSLSEKIMLPIEWMPF